MRKFSLSYYDFNLPIELIAQYPLKKRSESRLLVLNRQKKSFIKAKFSEIYKFIPENSLLIFNQSKVIPARLFGIKESTGGRVEFLLLTPLPLLNIKTKDKSIWNTCTVQGLLRPSKGIKVGMKIVFRDDIYLKTIKKYEYGKWDIELYWKGNLIDILKKIGHIPLPPYIKRKDEEIDHNRYQTVFAKEEKIGSVAAPTAGLHFDQKTIDDIKQKDIDIDFITLYVGAGTFAPIRCDDIRDHKMHSEYAEVSQETAKKIMHAKEKGKKIIPVGTTSVRTLEGVYEKLGRVDEYEKWIDLFIYPGFKFKVIDHMITNFHLPKSSLLVLVSAFAGRNFILDAYNFAIKNKYRFFSYGDCMLIL